MNGTTHHGRREAVIALIPAHNEAHCIQPTVRALLHQCDRVIVIADNCEDDTIELARKAGAETFETIGNEGRKAGALNQGLRVVLPELGDEDVVFVVDADTVVVDDFVARALPEFDDPDVGAVGSVFRADREDGYLRYCQSLEWYRYAEKVDRTGKVFVLTGTAALIKVKALLSVHEKYGWWYDEDSIVEDFAITVDLKECGWTLRSPIECVALTETMPTWNLLYKQRQRWYLGALQVVTERKTTPVLAPYLGQQFMLALSVFAMMLFLGVQSWIVGAGVFAIGKLWVGIGAVFVAERVYTVWPKGWKARGFAFLVIPELLFALWLQLSYLSALRRYAFVGEGTWHHVRHTHEKETN